MKAKATKSIPRPRKKSAANASAEPTTNKNSGTGFRDVETEWMNNHPEELRKCAGEYVVIEGRRIVAHNKDAAVAVQTAKRQGIKLPFIFFVEPPLPPNTYRIGWL
jgi:hypothetical protein